MIWKPFHRYWFGVNDTNVEMHDQNKGWSADLGGATPVVRLSAADPQFLEKLDITLKNYG